MVVKPVIPQRILDLQPYKPGKPIEEVERELGLGDSIKLASNENALGPSAAVISALREAAEGVHRYPDGGAFELTSRLAARLSVDGRRIVFGNGSNELIELLVRMFAEEGSEVVMSEDAFLIYSLVSQAAGATPVRVKAREFRHDVAAMGDAVGEKTRLVFLANPNNPTGTIFERDAWEAFLARVPHDVVVVVDEAYCEYVEHPEYPDALDYIDRHPGLVVLRTFSKVYGLAGLRLGYGVGSVEIMEAMSRLRQPFNVNLLAQVAAIAALDDEDYLEAGRALAREGRRCFAEAFERLGLDYVPSQANFMLVEVGDGAAVTDALMRRGVIVRPMGAYGFPSMIRVTFGTPEENERFVDALSAVMGER